MEATPRYRIEDCDVAGPLHPIKLDEIEHGLGIIVRRKGVPCGFVLRDCKPGALLTPDVLGQWIATEAGNLLIEQSIVDELQSPGKAALSPSLTVAICTRDRPDVLDRCLESLKVFSEQGAVDVLVVDNAPPSGRTADLVRRHPFARYTVEEKPGLDFARNRAWREATSDWVAYLDDDVVVDGGWLEGFRQALADNPDAGGMAGLVLPWKLDTEAEILFEKRGGFRRGFVFRRYGLRLIGNALHPTGAGIFGTGCNMAFRRDVLAELGGFDEALDTGRPLPGGGDLDIFYRVVKAGRPFLYSPAFLVRHEHRKDLVALRRQYYTWGLGLMAYVGKHLRLGGDRDRFRKLIRWWFRHQIHQLRECLRGRHVLPCSMLLAELWGACIGICWEYERSMRRVEKIRNHFR